MEKIGRAYEECVIKPLASIDKFVACHTPFEHAAVRFVVNAALATFITALTRKGSWNLLKKMIPSYPSNLLGKSLAFINLVLLITKILEKTTVKGRETLTSNTTKHHLPEL